ncbi:butyrophilin subfamily 1 member A1-like [Epinephelus fuscoguttatus]|uniref:butyrophilin subfamily 1 member A1-like n=1 Tax=Epinephelus fuscoguttatus TaxID=293821 RepID=UPI0020D08F7A|nr:butyrophilin subfamily 1 member A1-like [Epinephelus fuscoguttatus]
MNFKELTDTFSLWAFTLNVPVTFIIFLILVTYFPVDGQPQVIGSPQPVLAALGDDVILPCHVEPRLNVEKLTVEWWRPDVPPDPGDPLNEYKYVHRYHDNLDEEGMKMSSYTGRTTLFTDSLKHGNMSLKILKVKLSDQGRYRCFLPQLQSRVRATVIKFIVETKHVEIRTTETPPHPTVIQTPQSKNETTITGGWPCPRRLIPPVLFCVLLIIGGGYYIKRKCHKQDFTECDIPDKLLPL